MSMLPFVFRDMMSMMRPLRMLENHIRMTEELFQPFISQSAFRYPRNVAVEYQENEESVVIHDKNKFQIKLDVQNFSPQEITVKTFDNNGIHIEAKHEEKDDEKGLISRHFIRRFVLPKSHDLKNVISNLSADGILTITAPKNEEIETNERIIPITHTGPEREETKKSDKQLN